MTGVAPFALEHLLAAPGQRVEPVGIGRRLERVNVERERKELLVAIPGSNSLCEESSSRLPDTSRPCGNEIAVARQHVHTLIEGGVAHQVGDAPVPHQAAGIQVAPIFDPDQVGELRGGKGARALTGEDASRNREVDRLDVGGGELLEPCVGIGPKPGGRERCPLPLTRVGEEFFFVVSLRGVVSKAKVGDPLHGAIALRALDHRAVRHDARVTFPARRLAVLDLAPALE